MRNATMILLWVLLATSSGGSFARAQQPGGRPIGGPPPGVRIEPTAVAQTTPPAAPVTHRPRGRRHLQRGSTPIRAGLGTFSGTYGVSVLVGSLMIRADRTATSCTNCQRNGLLMCVPLAGPGVSLFLEDTRGARAFFGLVASVQLAGLLVAGIGAIPRRARGPTRQYGSDVYVGVGVDRLYLRLDF